MKAVKIFGTRIAGYSTHTPKARPARYGERMLRSPLDKSPLTARQEKNEKIYNSWIIRLKDKLGFKI